MIGFIGGVLLLVGVVTAFTVAWWVGLALVIAALSCGYFVAQRDALPAPNLHSIGGGRSDGGMS